MKSKYFKSLSLLLAGIIVFSACEDKDSSPNLGDAVGTWKLNAFEGTYERKVVSKAGVQHTADQYDLVASWKDAQGFAAATGADPAVVVGGTNRVLNTWKDGDDAPGFPLSRTLDAAGLALLGISLEVELLDSKSSDTPGTYNVKGTYPSVRLDAASCSTYLMIPPPQINDTGDWFANYETGKFSLAPNVDIEQVLPPFDDAEFNVNRTKEPAEFLLSFIDRDSHDSKYKEVMDSWNEANNRVITGINSLPRNTIADAFSVPEDPHAEKDALGQLVTTSEAYIYDPSGSLASWGNFLTWYAFNIIAETTAKAADVKNPLTDLDGSGSDGKDNDGDGTIDEADEAITPADMVIYMHADNLASGGGKTMFGMPYTLLVNSTDPTKPVPTDDSGKPFALSGLATGAGGKMRYVLNGVCIPVNETIEFNTMFVEVVQ